MEKKFIATGKDLEAAKQVGLKELGLEEDQVTVAVLERGKPGFLGIGARPWKVEITYTVPDAKPATALSSASRSKPKKAEAPRAESTAPKAEPPKPVEKKHEAPKPVEKKAEAPKPVEKKAEAPKPAEKKAEAPKAAEKKAPRKQEDRKPKEPKEPGEARESRTPREPKAPKEPRVYAPAQPGSVEESIETFLKGLMEHMGSDAVPHATRTGDNTYQVEMVGKDLGVLIGRRGETLDAIQHLTNYAVNRSTEGRIRISVDAEDYRVKREDSLRRYARKKAHQVLKARRRTTLEPMNAYERHVIHAALQDMDNITTHSTGTEPNRRVTIEYVR